MELEGHVGGLLVACLLVATQARATILTTHLPCRPSSLDILIIITVDGAQSFCLRLVDLTVIGCSCCGGCQGRVVGVLLLLAGASLPLFGRHRGAWREVALHPDLVAQHEGLEV